MEIIQEQEHHIKLQGLESLMSFLIHEDRRIGNSGVYQFFLSQIEIPKVVQSIQLRPDEHRNNSDQASINLKFLPLF